MKKRKVFYYSEEKNEDFGTIGHNDKPLKPDFKYIRKNVFFRFFSFILYYFLAFPILWVVSKIFLGVRFHGKKNLKELKKGEGYFVFANHTHYFDVFLMHVFMGVPKRTYVLSHPDPVNIPVIGTLVMMLGCLPIPSQGDYNNYKKFLRALKTRCDEEAVIAVFPEGTLWPYYNGLRPFPKSSVKYAVMNNKPIVVCAETYRNAKGIFKKPRMDVTVSHVFRPDKNKTVKENTDELYEKMIAFWEEHVLVDTNVGYYEYLPVEEKPNESEN